MTERARNGILRALKIAAIAVAILSSLVTGIIAHEHRYAKEATVAQLHADLNKTIRRQTWELKLVVLDNRRQELQQRVYELEAAATRRPLTETERERLTSWRGELAHLWQRIKTLQEQLDRTPD